jgi:hypothetical protein
MFTGPTRAPRSAPASSAKNQSGRLKSRSRAVLGPVAGLAAVAALLMAPAMAASAATAPASGTSAAGHAAPAHRAVSARRSAPAGAPDIQPVGKKDPTTHACPVTPKPGHMTCFALRRTDIKGIREGALENAGATPSGYGPSQLDSAYKLSAAGGSGQTVAIVDAQNDPNAASDLAAYRAEYGLPACTVANGCFRQVNQNGATSPLPTNDTGWAGEESLDIDMVSAICPLCKIDLVEANSADNADLYQAENEAVALGAKFVSNSWGGSEYSGQTTDDSAFNHPGVAITVAAGDDGYGAEYPATSQYVTAVGGTSLSTASNARGWTETAWNDGGSGCSAYDAKPTWQTVSTGSCTRRAEADVSAVADPNTGVAVYQTYGAGGWVVYGGTSVASPIIASVYALAGTPAAGSYPASYPYSQTASLFDVTSGSNGSCSPSVLCTAGTGWDGPTGLGSPDGAAAFASGTPSAPTVSNPGTQTTGKGIATSLTMSASGGTAPYSWSATGLPAGLSINATTGVISGTPLTAGSSTVNVTVKDAKDLAGYASFTWTVSAASCASPGQKLANPGFESGAGSWTSSTGVIGVNGPSEPAHTGTWDAWLDGYGTTHTDTLSQAVTFPAGCTPSLSFWLHIDTAETTTTTQFDKLTVTVNGVTYATFSNLNAAAGYTQHTYALPASLAGQAVTVLFTGSEDSSLQTSFVLDDIALNAS